MIAIHHKEEGFSPDWIHYCERSGIPYKRVNCYDSDIVKQLEDCDALMWHFHHASPKDILFAKELIYSLETAGKVVFPNFHTAWHFDDKVGQRYLLEAIDAPIVPSYVFYEKEKALEWSSKTEYPKVFKLRRGSGSSHVRLVEDERMAKKLIRQAFGKGFSQYNPAPNLKERWRKYKAGLIPFSSVLKGVLRFGYTTEFDRVAGNEKGYAYFQDFVPGNRSDIRIVIIHNRAFAIKRMVRENDFRASGSGFIKYEKENFDEDTVRLSFKIAEKLKSQSLAIDYLYDNGDPKIVEISYGYSKEVYQPCTGYWDRQLNWVQGPFNPQEWMVDSVLKEIRKNQTTAGSI
ncbi:hypothetical protein DYD21_20335 [Rhodohalobacter sp. SW132]|uniref:ATP-grasp domain-containing protein n=1 Tax=Rhodohalobacter sp. SW132 TaxID=2293433 RepID=UPI000E22790A|nr:hypothetical protein [Rhodohalobacter sp. SW132]REL23989.1 hypothetical protein DYD21_20335 [Rhodohalobacter sp. SW132]